MANAITFNGVRSDTHNLVILSTKRPLLPENKDTYIDIPKMSGTVLIPDSSLADIMVEVEFLLTTPINSSLFSQARNIAVWLRTTTWTTLVFDDDPDYTYKAKVTGNVDLEKIVDYGKFTVVFRCSPNEA